MTTYSFDSGTSTFEQDVIEASRQVPVIVDFWAPWCAPCRALKPVLEKLAAEYAGKFRLAKVNTDEHPEIAARYGVRGIPNVKAFVDGKLANEFTGALPEAGVRKFIEALLPSPSETLRRAAREDLANGEFDAAEAKLREALQLDTRNDGVRVDLAEVLVARQDFADAEPLLAALLADGQPHHRDDRIAQLAARIAVWRKGRELPDLDELKAAVDARPDDLDARIAYAERLIVDERYAPALDELLEVIRRDRGDKRERARKAVLDVFNLAAADADLVGEYRRRLASALN